MSDPCSRELLPFSQVKIGVAFMLPTHLGIAAGPYFKTGPESYGIAPGEPIWPWEADWGFVELCPSWGVPTAPKREVEGLEPAIQAIQINPNSFKRRLLLFCLFVAGAFALLFTGKMTLELNK